MSDGTPNEAEITVPQALELAVELQKQGRLAEAEHIFSTVLGFDPNNIDALHFLGVLRAQQGDAAAAVTLIEQAVAGKPDYFDALNNLGNVHCQLGQMEAAVTAYERALSVSPQRVDTMKNLGLALRKLKRPLESAALLRRARELAPNDDELLYSLGRSCQETGAIDEAAACLQASLALRPDADVFAYLGRVFYRAGRIGEAASTYEAWLKAQPNHPVAQHLLAACAGGAAPARATDDFVKTTFADFASTFDDNLGRLGYCGPALVEAALGRVLPPPAADLAVLDAGCGTGLLGPILRPYARKLVGMDLSAEMLARAAERSLYDETCEAELTAFLRNCPHSFDLVACADTFVYFGDLSEAMALGGRALRPGGHFAFTVERAHEGTAKPGYRLNPHGRFSHTAAHVRTAIAHANLVLCELGEAVLRRENGADVIGLVVVTRAAA